MVRTFTILALASAWAFTTAQAWAEAAAATPGGGVHVGAVLVVLWEVLAPVVAVLMSMFVAWAVSVFQKWANLKVSQQAKLDLQNAAANSAGRIFAAAEGDISRLVVQVGNPTVQREASIIAESLPGALKTLGIDPGKAGELLANLIAAKVGLLQAGAAPVASAVQSTAALAAAAAPIMAAAGAALAPVVGATSDGGQKPADNSGGV